MKNSKSVVLFLLGFALLGTGLYLGKDVAYLKMNGISVTGQVISQRVEPHGSGYLYYPIVRYSTEDGLSFNYEVKFGSSPPIHAKGEEVTVLYDVQNPKERVMIYRGWQNWLRTSLLGIMAAFCFFGSFYLRLKSKTS